MPPIIREWYFRSYGNFSSIFNGQILFLFCTDISELLLCRQKLIGSSFHAQSSTTQLPVCIPHQSIQLYTGVGPMQYDFIGRFTTCHRGVWRRTPDEQIQIVRKILKAEFRSSFSQVCSY